MTGPDVVVAALSFVALCLLLLPYHRDAAFAGVALVVVAVLVLLVT